MLTTAELLKPRFEVIADYPHNPHKIGDIIEARKGNISIHQTTISYRNEFGETVSPEIYCQPISFLQYPHLFRKLNWWEHRKKEDMPMKLISKYNKDYPEYIAGQEEIKHIVEWDMDILVGFTDLANRQGCSLLSWNPEYGYFPID